MIAVCSPLRVLGRYFADPQTGSRFEVTLIQLCPVAGFGGFVVFCCFFVFFLGRGGCVICNTACPTDESVSRRTEVNTSPLCRG